MTRNRTKSEAIRPPSYVTASGRLTGYLEDKRLRITCQVLYNGYAMTHATFSDHLDHAFEANHRSAPHGHQASLEDGLDFINTLDWDRGRWAEKLDSPEKALRWLADHELMHDDALERELALVRERGEFGEQRLEKVRRVRAALRELIEATVERRPADPTQLAEVNRALRTHYVYELVPAADGVSLDHRHEGDPVEGALARLTESIAREVSQGRPERLRVCENDQCRWVFLDTSRTARRKWCDMSTCGNRAKAARFRERQRSSEEKTKPSVA